MSTVPFSRSRPAPLPADIAKKLPSNLDAERSVLGTILLDQQTPNPTLKTVREIVAPEDYFLLQNRCIFRNMLFLADSQQPVEILSVVENLEHNGQLAEAGGAPYVSALVDGLARVSNVGYYAHLIKQKAMLRDLIHATQQIQQNALEGAEQPEKIVAHATAAIAAIEKPRNENPAVVVGFQSLLTMTMPALEYAIEPLLTTGGTGEIYAWRGTGKSFFATEVGVQIAIGEPILFPVPKGGGHWPVSRAYRVLYVYGEMHGSMIQERAQQIARGHNAKLPSDESFGIMCKDFQKSWRPNIATPRNRKIIEERIFAGGYEGVILDNISTLWPESQEGEGDRSAELSNWYMDLNQRGVWVIFLHHAGKGGQQRGSSEKEDMLDFVIRLQRPASKKNDPRLCAEVSLEKIRGECKEPRWMAPFEVALDTTDGAATWLMRPAQDAQLEAAFRMFDDGMKPSDIFQELGISRSTAFRYKKRHTENSDTKHWTDRDD